jgi:hypothetical protein
MQVTPIEQSQPLSSTSLLRKAPLAIVLAIAITDFIRRADVELWGDVFFGKAMLRERHMIVTEPYSYSAHRQVWHNHEWLSEVMMA